MRDQDHLVGGNEGQCQVRDRDHPVGIGERG